MNAFVINFIFSMLYVSHTLTYSHVYVHEIVNFSFFALYSLLLLSFFLYLKSVPIYVIVHVYIYIPMGDPVLQYLLN